MAKRISSLTFVGRRSELDDVTAALERASDGRPAVVFVAGEAGVGKTRFVEEIGQRALQSGVRVLAGGCVQLGGEGLPFAPMIEALRGLAATFSPERLDELLGTGRADLLRLMPSIQQQAHDRQRRSDFDRSGEGRLFEHLLLFLRRLSELAPIALIVEDIHWADRSTLELLGFLVHNLREGPIVLVTTHRSDELHRRHPLLPLLASLERGRAGYAERLELRRFDRRELSDQLEVLGAKAEAELVDTIYARSGGNAFFAEELLAAETSPGRLPETLTEVLGERLGTLSEPAQELIRVASAAGPRIRTPLLAAVSRYDDHTLSASLREALESQILIREGDDRLAFRHALVQEAAYDDLLPSERIHVHAAFAEMIAKQQVVADEGAMAAELAYHWQAAEDLPRALDASISAGLAAEAMYALSDAQAHFERALGLWERVPDAAVRAPFDRVELLVHAADAAEGRSPLRSLAHIRSAIALVDESVDATRAGLLHERLGEYAVNLHTLDFNVSLAAYREAVRLVPAEPPSAARAKVLAGLAKCLAWLQTWAEHAAVCEEALRVARAVGDRQVETSALASLAFNLRTAGRFEDGLTMIRRAREIATDSGDRSGVALCMSTLASCYLDAAQYENAAATALEAADHAVRDGLAARFGVGLLRHAAVASIALGRWDEAQALLDRAQQYYPSLQEVDIEGCLLTLEAFRGDFASATRRASAIEPLAMENLAQLAFVGVAELAFWGGDPLAVRESMRTAIAIRGDHPQPRLIEMGQICILGVRAEADLAEGARASGVASDLRDARRNAVSLLARMRSLAEEVSVRRPFFDAQAQACLAICEAEWRRVEGVSDPDLWATAAVAWDDLHVPYRRAYALMREGQAALAGHRDRSRARDSLATAHAIAVELGAEPLRRSIDDLAARAGGRGAGAARITGRGSTVSPRELEVLLLIAAGQSDGEIAETLFISKKTASVHVAHIKSKLGARSRVEIATQALALGFLPGQTREPRGSVVGRDASR